MTKPHMHVQHDRDGERGQHTLRGYRVYDGAYDVTPQVERYIRQINRASGVREEGDGEVDDLLDRIDTALAAATPPTAPKGNGGGEFGDGDSAAIPEVASSTEQEGPLAQVIALGRFSTENSQDEPLAA